MPVLDDVVRLVLEGEEAPQETVSVIEAQKRGMTTDQLRAEKGIAQPKSWVAGAYERRLAQFVVARMDEAQFADAWHMLPDNLPINRQPWWKMQVWRRYLSGCDSGRRSQQQ